MDRSSALAEAFREHPRAKALEGKKLLLTLARQQYQETLTALNSMRDRFLHQEKSFNDNPPETEAESAELDAAMKAINVELKAREEAVEAAQIRMLRLTKSLDIQEKAILSEIQNPGASTSPEPEPPAQNTRENASAAGLLEERRFAEAEEAWSALTAAGTGSQRAEAEWNVLLARMAQGKYAEAEQSTARLLDGTVAGTAFAFAAEAILLNDWPEAQRWVDEARRGDLPGHAPADAAPFLEGFARMGWLDPNGVILVPPP